MKEFPSPFCPEDCKFNGVPVICTHDCNHQQDQVFKEPQEIEFKWCGVWKKAKIIGRNGDYLYLDVDGSKQSINIRSPLIR